MMKSMIVTDYKGIIAKCFAQDQDLISRWHLNAGRGLSDCIMQTHADMLNAKVEFHAIHEGDSLVGYFGKEQAAGSDFLTGFFVMPEYRTKKHLFEFWHIVNSSFTAPFFCGLFEKNKPAIDFIKRNGGKLSQAGHAHGQPALIFKLESSCQHQEQ